MTFAHQSLPVDFVPGPQTVIVGKGKRFFKHEGNQMLRDIAASKIAEYAAAKTKLDKSEIISSVVELVRCSYGGYVKQHSASGQWLVAEDLLCREKTSGVFREALQTFKKSQQPRGSLAKAAKATKKVNANLFQMPAMPAPPTQKINDDLFQMQMPTLAAPKSMKTAAGAPSMVNTSIFASLEFLHQVDSTDDLSFGFPEACDEESLSGLSLSLGLMEADANDPHFFELPEF